MSIKASFFFMSISFAANIFAGGQLPIDLNTLHVSFQIQAATVNVMYLLGHQSAPYTLDPSVHNIIDSLRVPAQVTVVPLRENNVCTVCTKELTRQILDIWDKAYQQTLFYKADYATASQFLPTVYDGVAIAMYQHGDLHLQPHQ